MKIAMIGTGYVGLVSGICFSDFGHDVVCVNKDTSKIDALRRGEVPIYEPGLKQLMAKNVDAGRLTFTLDLQEAITDADAVFIAVGTPTRRGDGHADLSYVYAAAEEIAKTAQDYIVVVTKSTVPVGTNRQVKQIIRKTNPNLQFDVASNPEFLREGAAIEDFMRPDRVVIGVQNDRAKSVMEDIYRPLYLRDYPIVSTDLESAELIKYAANAFLATKITFMNEMAALCERVGADVKEVANGIGLDSRTRERTTITANIYIYDSSDALKRRYTLGSMYLRDDASRYDSGIISGHAMLELTAGDKIALAVRRLDAQYSDATYVHPAETRLLIERIDYELV